MHIFRGFGKHFRLESATSILAAFAISLLGFLGSHGLFEPDEGRYAEASREMARQSDWLVPHLAGAPHLTKPPLVYWIAAVSIRLFGANGWAARLPSALAALATLAATMHLGRLLFDRSTGWNAGLILASTILFGAMSRVLTPDMLLTSWTTLSIASFIHYDRKRKTFALLLFYTSLGLGFLTKGPMAYLVPFAALLPWLATRSRGATSPLPRWHWLPGLFASLALGASWFLALYHRYPEISAYYFHNEFIDRIASNAHHRAQPIWFYTAITIAGMFPWSVAFPRFLHGCWNRRTLPLAPEAWLLTGWILLPWILLHFVVSKQPTYILPLFPAMAIGMARMMELSSDKWFAEARWAMVACAIAIAASPIIAILYGEEIHWPIHPGLTFAGTSMLVGVLWMAAYIRTSEATSIHTMVRHLSVPTMVSFLFINWQAGDFVSGRNKSMDAAARDILQAQAGLPGAIVVAPHMKKFGLEFYLQQPVLRSSDSVNPPIPVPDTATLFFKEDPMDFITKHPELDAIILMPSYFLSEQVPNDWETVKTYEEMHLFKRPGNNRTGETR